MRGARGKVDKRAERSRKPQPTFPDCHGCLRQPRNDNKTTRPCGVTPALTWPDSDVRASGTNVRVPRWNACESFACVIRFFC